MNVALVEAPGQLRDDDVFIVQLLASVWARAFVDAARHGLPALHADVHSRGEVIRGRLDVARTVRELFVDGRTSVSVRRERSLNHAASRAIVAGYAALQRWIGGDERWLPARARELLPALIAVTGARPPVPTLLELRKIRYTPITAGFAAVARLSQQIALQRGLGTDAAPEGRCKGVLLDVAELWEAYVLGVLRRASTGCVVRHGTREDEAAGSLLRSGGATLGRLRPDALVMYRDRVVAVVDAKYKQLHPTPPLFPQGPQREDLYQIAAYAFQFAQPHGGQAVLAYPLDPERPEITQAEQRSPWGLPNGVPVSFVALPHDLDSAVEKIRTIIRAPAPSASRQPSDP